MPTFDYTCEVCGHQGREWRNKNPPRFCCKACKTVGMAGERTKPRKYIITPEMAVEIRKVYGTVSGNGEVKALASKLKLPRWKISKWAVSQGLIARSKKEPDWTEKELQMLEHLSYLTPLAISRRMRMAGFKRSELGVLLKRRRMRFLQNLEGHSSRAVAECFGVDDHCVTRWIALGYLKAKRRGTNRTAAQGGDIYYIKDKWIRDFVINNVAEIDIRKVDKYWLVDLLAGGNVGTGPARIGDEDGDDDGNDQAEEEGRAEL